MPETRAPERKGTVMSEPFVYIGDYRIKPGLFEVAVQRLRDIAALVEDEEPQLLSFHYYVDPDRGRAICVQVHPDGESMATHMSVIARHITTAWDWLDLDGSVQLLLGTPPKVLTDYLREFNQDPNNYPTFVAGFARTAEKVSGSG